MDLQIRPGAALDSARDIEKIVSNIETAMETLTERVKAKGWLAE